MKVDRFQRSIRICPNTQSKSDNKQKCEQTTNYGGRGKGGKGEGEQDGMGGEEGEVNLQKGY